MNLLDVVIDQRLQNYVVALAKMSGKSISFLLFLYVPGDDNFVEKNLLAFGSDMQSCQGIWGVDDGDHYAVDDIILWSLIYYNIQ